MGWGGSWSRPSSATMTIDGLDDVASTIDNLDTFSATIDGLDDLESDFGWVGWGGAGWS